MGNHLGVVHGLEHRKGKDDTEGEEDGIRGVRGKPADEQEKGHNRNRHVGGAQGTQANGHRGIVAGFLIDWAMRRR